MKRGELVPDTLVIDLIKRKLGSAECERGVLLDGFPRTLAQAEMLDELFEEKEMNIGVVLEFQEDEEVLLEEIEGMNEHAMLIWPYICSEGRRIHPASGRSYHLKLKPPKVDGLDDITGEPLIHRADDTREALNRHMVSYRESTTPILDFYDERGILHTLNATAP